MKRIGGVMPEDMQPADAIAAAKKRLKENKAILGQTDEPKKLDKKG